MEIIIHRINNIKTLKKIDKNFGCEIDIRTNKSELILNHDPYIGGDIFEDYLDNYNHGTLVLNIKESGIENDVLQLVKKYQIKSYFLLDTENPYIYYAQRNNIRSLALRFSEYEPIENINYFKNKFEWVWIDTPTKFPILNNNIYNALSNFKLCLVCPERWSQPEKINLYKKIIKKNNFKIDAVMTSLTYAEKWLN
tara:strand:- start:952 stop:1539 length:588 start_codon:yes stop_codon:yes gene_type:complete